MAIGKFTSTSTYFSRLDNTRPRQDTRDGTVLLCTRNTCRNLWHWLAQGGKQNSPQSSFKLANCKTPCIHFRGRERTASFYNKSSLSGGLKTRDKKNLSAGRIGALTRFCLETLRSDSLSCFSSRWLSLLPPLEVPISSNCNSPNCCPPVASLHLAFYCPCC